jgi:hypothetical protein
MFPVIAHIFDGARKSLPRFIFISIVTLFYALIVALGICAVTVIQVRQEIGPNLDALLAIQTLEDEISTDNAAALTDAKLGSLATDKDKAQQFAADSAGYIGAARMAKEKVDVLLRRLKNIIGK